LIAEACSDLNLQLVISLGNRFEPMLLDGLSGRPVVTRYAPQLQLLKIAQAVITHGGSNTVLETLAEGKPMIVIPNVYDQPAMAARLERLHVARILPLKRLDARGLRSALEAVLDDPNYGAAAMRIQTRMQASSGRARAADIIEEALDRYLDHARLTSHSERFQLNNGSRHPCIETASKLSS
jgi:MGT family glycosyltransferase